MIFSKFFNQVAIGHWFYIVFLFILWILSTKIDKWKIATVWGLEIILNFYNFSVNIVPNEFSSEVQVRTQVSIQILSKSSKKTIDKRVFWKTWFFLGYPFPSNIWDGKFPGSTFFRFPGKLGSLVLIKNENLISCAWASSYTE